MEKSVRSKIGALESHIDYLETEMSFLNHILKECGFPDGIPTLKLAIQEMLENGPELTLEKEDLDWIF